MPVMFRLSTLIPSLFLSFVALADENHNQQVNPSSHAPSGVMADHAHKQGEWMFGYRYMKQEFTQLYKGSHKISSSMLSDAGFSMAPIGMTMDMHMLEVMYALNDTVTLMLMPQYMSMDMTMEMLSSDGGHHMNGHSSMHMDNMDDMHSIHQHSTSALADTQISALVKLYQSGDHQILTNLGLSIPTGEVDNKNASGQFTHYGMQIGSGTYDFVPSITYTGSQAALSWGTQLSANIKLEDENKSGFKFGDKYSLSAWLSYQIITPISLSTRITYQTQNSISGHYNAAHSHSSPSDIQANYGGQFTDLGLGINYAQQSGLFKGVRLGIEWQTRLLQNYNGYQLGLDDGLNLSATYAF